DTDEGITNVSASDRFSGNGANIDLELAQQGANLGQVLKWDGNAWTPADDVTGGTGNVSTSPRISGNGTNLPLDIAQQGASNGEILKWNGNNWVPDTDETGLTTVSVSDRFSGDGANVDLELAQQGANLGQVLKWDGNAWTPADDVTGGTGNVSTSPRISGNGTNVPLDIAQQGAGNGEILKWNGNNWVPDTDEGITNVSASDRFSGNGANIDLELAQQGANLGQVLKWDGNAWTPADDVTGGTGNVSTSPRISGNGTNVPLDIAQQGANSGEVLKWNGINWVPEIDAVGIASVNTSDRIQGDGVNTDLDIAQQGATVGQVLKWNGTIWAPDDDVSGGLGIINTSPRISGNGTNVPLDIAQQGALLGHVMKWDGNNWTPKIDEVNDPDPDPLNEIQTLSLSGNTLSLSQNGGSVNLPVGAAYIAGNGIDIAGNVIENTGDLDNTNEIQTLSFNNSNRQLSLSNGGGTVTIPAGGNGNGFWDAGQNGSIHKNNSGNVGIGVTNPIASLHLDGGFLLSINGNSKIFLGAAFTGEGLFDVRGPNGNRNAVITHPGNGKPNYGFFGVHNELGRLQAGLKVESDPNRAGTDQGKVFAHMGEFEVIELKDSTDLVPGATRVRAGFNPVDKSGQIDLFGSGNNLNVRLGSTGPSTGVAGNKGFIGLYGNGGEADLQAGIEILGSGRGHFFGASMKLDGTAEVDTLAATVKNFRVQHPTEADKEIWYASIEGPEAAAYVRGTATLVDGKAIIEFPEHFELMIDESSLTISTSPWSADSKGLAVVKRTVHGFEVQELLKGEGNYKFDWEAKAVRKGYENFKVVRTKKELRR
ncbi:MAG: hypothetical protein R8P61_34135, partial [Bacteroidia bacterium]|nr:hypothetical protein [Bacteroidia bacterium]